MRLILLGDCAFGLGPFHDHSGDPVIVNFGFMRAKIDSVGSMAGGCAGIDTPESRYVFLGGSSNAIRAFVRGMEDEDFYQEVYEDLEYLANQFSWWNLAGRLVMARALPVNDRVCEREGVQVSNRYMKVVNRALEDACARHSLTLVNLEKGLCDAGNELREEYTTDGLHLNEKGYLILKDNLLSFFI
jgi:lysophospholipase L1-like esterase